MTDAGPVTVADPATHSDPVADRDSVPYPPPPWQLKGQAVLQLQRLDCAPLRERLPAGLSPVVPALGQTIGGILLANYTRGSTLQYNELIVIAGAVRYGVRVGGWISHIYVDDPRSAAGGRNIWGLPKQLAAFHHAANGDMVVSQGDRILCSIHDPQPGRVSPFPLPVLAPVLSRRDDRILWFRASGTARIGRGSGRIQIPGGSPLAPLGFGTGQRIHLQGLDVMVRAPR